MMSSTTSVPSGPGQRGQRPPALGAHQVLAQIDRAARKADAAQRQGDQREDQGGRQVGVFQRIEGQVALVDNGRVTGLVRDERVAELVNADAEDPGIATKAKVKNPVRVVGMVRAQPRPTQAPIRIRALGLIDQRGTGASRMLMVGD
jgi:hypothetical protein